MRKKAKPQAEVVRTSHDGLQSSVHRLIDEGILFGQLDRARPLLTDSRDHAGHIHVALGLCLG